MASWMFWLAATRFNPPYRGSSIGSLRGAPAGCARGFVSIHLIVEVALEVIEVKVGFAQVGMFQSTLSWK